MGIDRKALDTLRIERPAQSRRRVRWTIPALIAISALAASAAWVYLARSSGAALEVRTAVARAAPQGSAGAVLNASGYVTARLQATVSSKITGKVTEVLIEEGMRVERGQVLARLDATNANAELRLAASSLGSARAELGETAALHEEARLNLKRTEDLIRSEVASQRELDRATAEAGALAARLERQRQDVRVAEDVLGLRRQEVEDTIIRAPFDGVVVAKNAQPGEMISPMSAGGFTRTGIGTLVDMSSLEVEVDVNESYINRVQPGQAVTATLDSYPDWRIPCHVIAIIPTADRQKATVKVRIGFASLDPRILPDMGVKTAFHEEGGGGPPPAGVLIPRAAVVSDGGDNVVFVVSEDRAARRSVVVAAGTGEEVMVTRGIAAGDTVIVGGPANLGDGARVRRQNP